MFYYVCGGWVSYRRVAGRLTDFVRSCRDLEHDLGCGRGERSVHTGVLLALSGGPKEETS